MALEAQHDLEKIENHGIRQGLVAELALPGIMKSVALRLLDFYRMSTGNLRFPIEFPGIAIYRKILRIVAIPQVSGRSGSLVPVEGGFHIFVGINDPSTRRRWTIAHELGHTYFFDISEPRPVSSFGAGSDFIERLCDEFSSELLMPQWSILNTKHLMFEQFNHASVETDASRYGVSIQAFFIRLGRLEAFKSTSRFALLFENVPNRHSGFARKLRVTTSLVPRVSGMFVPTNIGFEKLGLRGPESLFQSHLESLSCEEAVSVWVRGGSGKFVKAIIPCKASYKCYEGYDHTTIVGLFELQ